MQWARRILVVEDDVMVASLVAESLTREGFETAVAHNAVEAREQVQATDPDAAVIDINLGSGPSGLQVGQWLHGTHPHIALVFLSRHVDPRSAGAEQWHVPPGASFLSKDRMRPAQVKVASRNAPVDLSPPGPSAHR